MKPLIPKFPHLLHGGDYNPEQWLNYPGVLEKDIELMKKARINCVSVGIFSWAMLEPEEGRFTFDWLQEVIDRLYQNEIYTVLATPSGSKPIWMSEKYEEIRRVNSMLQREQSGLRHNHCYTSPVYREKVKIMDTKLAERFASHPGVILWHLSNEYGGVCYCPLCQEAFRGWLKERYQNIDAVNEAWWTTFWSHRYSDWSQINPPLDIGENHTHGLTVDWKRFTTAQVVDFMRQEIRHVRAANPEIPVTTNLMYDFECYNYGKFADDLDVISWDSYPSWHSGDDIREASNFAFWHDYMRSLKDQPFLLMESVPSTTNWSPAGKLKRPHMHFTSSMQAVAHGSNSVQYFQFRKSRGAFEKFHGAVVDHNGEGNTRVYGDICEVGEGLEKIDEIYHSTVKAEVAVLYDTESRWALKDASGPRNGGLHFEQTARNHYHPFWKKGIPVDVIDEEHALDAYKLVVAPMAYMLRNGYDKTLRSYVENGGSLVFTYHSGIVNDTDLCFLGGWPGNLMDVFGIWNEEIDGLYDEDYNEIDYKGNRYRAHELCAILHEKGAEVLGRYQMDFYQGSPAITVNRYGQGKAYYIAAGMEEDFLTAFYGDLIADLQLEPALDTELPHGVTAGIRKSAQASYIFVQNYNGNAVSFPLGGRYTDMLSGMQIDQADIEAYDTIILKAER